MAARAGGHWERCESCEDQLAGWDRISLLTLEQLVGQQHGLDLVEAQTGDGVGEALLGLAVGAEEQQTFFDQSQELLP